MYINNKELVAFLKEKKIKHLHHANSVSTWTTFIENNALLSRRYVKSNGLWQTYQASDETDEKLDVDDDVFLDILDLHKAFNRRNTYGSVVGVFSVEALEDEVFNIAITTNNPIYWKDEEKYFSSLDNYIEAFYSADNVQKARMMLTIRKTQEGFPLDFLEYLILDNPHISLTTGGDKYDLFDMGKITLETALDRNDKTIPIKTRSCPSFCKCNQQYQSNGVKAAFMFIDQEGLKRNFHKEFQ
jgi:hypothetical protein